MAAVGEGMGWVMQVLAVVHGKLGGQNKTGMEGGCLVFLLHCIGPGSFLRVFWMVTWS